MKTVPRRMTCLLVLVSAFLGLADGRAAERRLGTCGPPPRKSPQRQTAAEAMPPLPLPAVPLRRSEPKAEPTAPIMIAKLDYGTTQDWNTDPGDADNLTRHCRYQLGLWYAWKPLTMAELVAQHAADQRCKIPILYMSGHEAFELTPQQRAAIRQYVLDGGMLLGDACCGQTAFAVSFRTEAIKMFPDRAFDVLELDHPIYRAFYPYETVHFIHYEDEAKQESVGPPQMLGMNIGCRTAIALTPWDMSCGWDEHTHERGDRLLPGDAVRLGVNLISYAAALRPLGESQATVREIVAASDRPRQQLFFAQLRHQGDWNPDPNSVIQLFRDVAQNSSLAIDFSLKQVDPVEAQLAPHPFLFLTGHSDPKFTEADLTALRRHLEAGGFLLINNCCGRTAFDRACRDAIARMFPDQPLAKLPADHPLRSAFFKLGEGRDRLTGAARPIEIEGIALKNRAVLVYSPNDAVTQLKQVSDPYGNGYDADTCRAVILNIIAYAIQN